MSKSSCLCTNCFCKSRTEKRRHGAVVLCLGLLTVFLLAGLIGLSVHILDHKSARGAAAKFSTMKTNLNELLQDSENKVSSLTEERHQLNMSLIKTTEELNRLQSLSTQRKTCPAGWTMFSWSCYLLSTESGSWTKGRDECCSKGAGPRSSDRRLYGAIVLCLGLLSLFMLVGLTVLGVHYCNSAHGAAAEIATIKSNLTGLLQDSEDKVSSLTEQRDQLIDRLNTTTEELNKLQSSWTKGRDDCRNRGSDLVVITSAEEQRNCVLENVQFFFSDRQADPAVIDSAEEQSHLRLHPKRTTTGLVFLTGRRRILEMD
ncbi:hypothetical protein Q5P01_013930 [Channa striata]|uniref:Uncharacterized protein n=1 Tax=Channa striata TaxID=64152 RepID=A0AA88MNA4_CHASR|nr:hypothetical protein Q5P01_013930 [Channa striata]